MSLTVASTLLDTTWTEFSTVSFTAGSLADIDACVTEVESKLRRGVLSETTQVTNTEVKRWLNFAKQDIAGIRNFTWSRRYATATLVAGTYRYGLPPDFGIGRVRIRDKTNDTRISLISPHQFDILYPDPSEVTSGSIIAACIKGMELWVCPPPDGADIVEMEIGLRVLLINYRRMV